MQCNHIQLELSRDIDRITELSQLSGCKKRLSLEPTDQPPCLLITCGFDLDHGNMCHKALTDLLDRFRIDSDIDALPNLGGPLPVISKNTLPFGCDLREIFGNRQKDYGHKGESLEDIFARLVRAHPHVDFHKLTTWLQDYLHTMGFLLLGCKSGNHRAQAIGEYIAMKECPDGGKIILVHLSALYYRNVDLTKEVRDRSYNYLSAIAMKAIVRATRNFRIKDETYTRKWFWSACSEDCVLCLSSTRCALKGLHEFHICQKCSETKCFHQCQRCCTHLCSRPLDDHQWHYCDTCSDHFSCQEVCYRCQRYQCIRKKPSHLHHECSNCRRAWNSQHYF